jgi:nicotinate-nucleotide adenylyltransferase
MSDRSTSGPRRSDLAPRTSHIGILGGTLDPLHCGHLAAATAARDAFDLSTVFVLPSHVPPHRPVQPAASPFHRFAMASLAVSGVERLQVSDDELRLAGPSYTADTLERMLARGFAASQIFFITGADAFAEIATWKRYPAVLDLANFVVVSRPGHDLTAMKARLPELAPRMRAASDIGDRLSDIDPRLSHIGDRTATPSIYLLETATPDVSSTQVRERLRRGEPITGLVPPLVEAHIHKHALYGAPELHGQND